MPSCARLIMRVSKQANNYHPIPNRATRPQPSEGTFAKDSFTTLKQLCLVYLSTLYTPGP